MFLRHVRGFRFPFIISMAFGLAPIWPHNAAHGQGAAISPDTKSGFLKSNQSKIFYHDGTWWAVAFNAPDSRWYIWKFSDSVWTKDAQLDKSATRKFDAVIDSAQKKLYLLGSHSSASEFRRFSYANGSWKLDTGFPVNPGFVNTDGNNPISLVQAKNGALWIFRLEGNKLQAKRSIDAGANWSPTPINVKTSLKIAVGTTDAVAFSSGGNDFVGVAFGEADNAGAKFGFLYHQDGAADSSWKDETASLLFFGAERGSNQITLTTDNNNNIYLLTKNGNALGEEPRNTLYKRVLQGGSAWQKFKVNTSADWKSPAIAFDATNGRIFLMGINSASQNGEYKTCAVGQEAALAADSAKALFSGAGATFADLSAPQSGMSVNIKTGLMVGADNNAASDIWYRHLKIASIVPVKIDTITVTPNQVNASAAYKIPLKLSAGGSLVAGAGTITLVFPKNTLVPKKVAASKIFVNGKACTKVMADSIARQVKITTPVNLKNGQSFVVMINAGAGLLNPTLAGAYRLNASTSAQPATATSPKYNLIAATSKVTPAAVTPSPNEPDSCANYKIAFKLGANGRLLPGASTFTVVFNTATKITDGQLAGAKVNGVAANAVGNSTTKTVILTLPAAVSLSNGAAVTLQLPACNPAAVNNYTVKVFTSVEKTPVTSNPYKIIGRITVGAIKVNPSFAGANAIYTIPLTLSSNGALAAGAGVLNFRFPAGTTVPNNIAPNHVTVNDTAVPPGGITSNSAAREVKVTTPVNLTGKKAFSVAFALSAGLVNPSAAGDYTLEAWTSAQPAPANSSIYSLSPSFGGSPISTSTQSGYKKSNQSKVFYYDTQWWAIAYEEPENRWYIWKFNGAAWTKVVDMDKGSALNYDVVVNASAKKIYLFAAHGTASKFRRYSYIGGTWKNDSGFPLTMSDFNAAAANNPISLVQAKNGDLWIFRINAGILQAKHSSNGGEMWSPVIEVKSGLHTANGVTDAVAFTAGGKNYVGVGYGETNDPASQFGFFMHEDGTLNDHWTNESAALKFFGTERALDQMAMTTDANGNVYLVTQNTGAAFGAPNNTLYKRSAGVWKKFKVNSATAMWKTPALAVDVTSNVLYLMGVNTKTLLGEYKVCEIGAEAKLDSASAKMLFNVSRGQFDDLSVPAANVNAGSGLMVCADNLAANDIYYRYLELGGSAPVAVGAVKVVSNQINANASYTIPLKLSSIGGLEAGSGELNFIFPPNTFVPNNMPAPAVKIGGVPAKTVIANNISRQVTVTTPVKLPNEHSFSVVFDSASGAGLLNATTIGAAYRVTCWTSAQPKQATSPPYSLVQTTTKVTPAFVKTFPTDPNSVAEYALAFSLGARGRLISGTSSIVVKFSAATKVSTGPIIGVTLNGSNAAAVADSMSRKVTVTVPADLSLSNNAAITLAIPKSKIRNPNVAGFQTLLVATSVETTFVKSQPFTLKASRIVGAPIAGTKKSFDRNNQSKVFYHGGFWWVAAHSKLDGKWYLWKFNGSAWAQNALIYDVGRIRPDCVLDAANNKLYILLPGASITYLTRLSYASKTSTWSVDPEYPASVPDFAQTSDRGLTLTRAKNGHLWVFRAASATLTAKRSGDSGLSWSPLITVKKNLHNLDALADATAFTLVSGNYVGVGYAENSSPGSVYGFLRHNDAAADTSWQDETETMPQFVGTTSDDHLSMMTYNGEVFMLVKTNGGAASAINVGLLRRNWNGVWSLFPVLLSSGWTRPVMAVDETNKRLYVFGSREGGVKVGEMKKCAIGDYKSLLAAPSDTVFKNDLDNFFDLSVPAHTLTSKTNLLIGVGNDSRDELWYNLINLGAAKTNEEKPTAEGELAGADFDGVQVFPNPFNPQTSFRFKVKENARVKLQIFNLTGQVVRTIVDEDFAPGVYQRRWNGRAQDGRPAASGLYFYRLQIGQQVMKGRIQMVK